MTSMQPAVAALFDAIEAECGARLEFTPCISRERAEAAVHALLRAFGCREGSTASVYAFVSLWEALGVDMASLRFVDEAGPGAA
ncbi:MAG TPA: hypothetical protein VMG08_12885 [Allosphingosinicella sp.]|nr:hypothetical protein [Allosphingosinicella sp.]